MIFDDTLLQYYTKNQYNINGRSTIFLTLTNYGYILYTLNMLKSLKQWNLDRSILIICLDVKSYNILQRLGYKVYYINDSTMSNFYAYNTPGYEKVCYIKMCIWYYYLEHGIDILYADGDIVFMKNPMSNIESISKKHETTELFIQNDSMIDQNMDNLCTGFLLIRSTQNTINLFNCISEDGIQKYNECAFKNNDQSFVNIFIKPYVSYIALPLEMYPNGQYFYQHHVEIEHSAVLVHFNWIKGHNKMIKMREHQLWLLTEEDEEMI